MPAPLKSNIRFGVTGFQHGRIDPAKFPEPFRRMVHVHHDIEINFIERGSLTYRLGASPVTIAAKRFAVFWAVMPHQILSSARGTVLNWFHIPLPWFLGWRFRAGFRDAILHGELITDGDAAHAASDLEGVRRWSHDLRSNSTEFREIVLLEIEARLKRLAVAFDNRPRNRATSSVARAASDAQLMRAERMAHFIAHHFADGIGVDEVARAVELHPDSAGRLFRRSFGTNLVDYLTQHRIFHAQRLLVTSSAKILDVALASGFGSLSQFYASFAKQCGCSPSNYRNAARARTTSLASDFQ